jgi:hypothetical protein
MKQLEAALRRKDSDAHIYFAPNSVRAGGFWLPSLANEIAKATIFVLPVGEKGIGPWQVMEYYEALARRVKEQHEHPYADVFPVVLMLLTGQPAPGLPFLRQLHWIVTDDPASEKSLALLMDATAGAGTTPSELWRHTAPYRGLAAMSESDADFFFGRGCETIEVIKALEAFPEKLPILLGNSGVGKSSLAQAGVLAAFMRQAWPESAETAEFWPQAFGQSRRWCFLKLKPGTEPVRALVEPFLWTWQFDAVDPQRAELLSSWVNKLLDDKVALRDLLDATGARYRDELHQPAPPAFLLYIDQGEELYVRAEQHQRRRFSEILACGLSDVRLRAMLSMRADFFGELQKDEALYAVHRLINVPPLREAQLCEVVSRPAMLLSVRFETKELAASIARRTAEESTKDAGALPLLSYLLDDMWRRTTDGVLRLPAQAIELGGVLVHYAEDFLRQNPRAEEQLRRIFTLNLATVREDGEPTRRSAPRSEFSDDDWRLITALADYPYRLLVTATSDDGRTYAEVAHEAIFRRWGKLREWIMAEREFLAWRSGLETQRRAWQATPDISKDDALLMGLALRKAQSWLEKRPEQIHPVDQQFVLSSLSRNASAMKKATRQKRLAFASLSLLTLILVGGAPWVYSVFSKHRQETIELLDKALSEKAQTTAGRVDQAMDDIQRQISFATRASATTIEQRLQDYQLLLHQVPDIDRLVQLDSDGREQLRASRREVVKESGLDWSSDPRFAEAHGQVWVSRVRFDGYDPYMAIAMPHSERTAGSTVADIKLQSLSTLVDSARIGKYDAYIVDSTGRLLAHSDRERRKGSNFADLPQVDAALKGRAPLTFGRDPDGRSVLTATAKVPGLNWHVFFEQPPP